MIVLTRTVLPVLLLGSLLTGCATHSDGTAPSINAPGQFAASSAAWSVVVWAQSRVVPGPRAGQRWVSCPAA